VYVTTHILLGTLKTHVKDVNIKLWDTLTLSNCYLHGVYSTSQRLPGMMGLSVSPAHHTI